jgi:catechol 2,3-dioxygenase
MILAAFSTIGGARVRTNNLIRKEGFIMVAVRSDLKHGFTQKADAVIPEGTKLHVDTKLGYVHLTISDMQRSVDFYQSSLGFQVHRQESGTTYLGAGGEDLVALTEIPGAVKIPRRSGLYHFAILSPSREALAGSLRNLIDTETSLQGGADHLVSEALYLSDPDGNGIEIYRDRPRSDWKYENGDLKMGTEALDYQGILSEVGGERGGWTGLEVGTRLGHMHLHVSNLAEAAEFYEKVLGFDFLLSYMGSASFLSAGGYHHHIGINIWNGEGVPPPPPDTIGLRYFTVQLAQEDEQQRLIERLNQARVPYETYAEGLLVRDLSQNGILFVVENEG